MLQSSELPVFVVTMANAIAKFQWWHRRNDSLTIEVKVMAQMRSIYYAGAKG